MKFIKVFQQLNKDDVSLAGGKGASLGEMTRVDIPVPPGFVILSAAFEKFLAETDLNVEIDSILHSVNHKEIHTVENASEKIKALILDAKISKDISDEIQKSFKKLGSKYVAVRSSATAEDSASAAWAGQLESYLNTTKENLLENIKKCWASLFTPRAIFYRFEKELHRQKISVAVVVQKMIQSEISGIAFSVHPITRDKNQLIIEAGFGLGEAIVSGQITPDSYVTEKNDWQILDKNVNKQKKKLIKAKTGGNRWVELLNKEKERQILSDEKILELSRLIVKIEKHYNFPVDIEWALENDKFYILQSRPITTGTKPLEQDFFRASIKDYQRLFRFRGVPYLIASIFGQSYKKLKCLYAMTDNTATSYLPKKIVKKTLEEGAKFYYNKERFKRYKNELSDCIINLNNFIKKVSRKTDITKKELLSFFGLVIKINDYYIKTEFFYTDKAFEHSSQNKILKTNLTELEKIKNSTREYTNGIFVGSNSYFNKVLAFISKQFGVSISSLYAYGMEDLTMLFDGKKVSEKTIKNRGDAWIMKSDGQIFRASEGKEAENAIENFLKETKSTKHLIQGVIANRGMATGKVKIILSDFATFDQLKSLMGQMNKGDILVSETTSPELMVACHKATAIITNQGGLMSHAAIVSRELDIPCIVGASDATDILKDGDFIEVDAIGEIGVVKILSTASQTK